MKKKKWKTAPLQVTLMTIAIDDGQFLSVCFAFSYNFKYVFPHGNR